MSEFLELSFAGIALGSRYALVALGFVIIFRATGVINFAHGGLMLLGAYFAYALIATGMPFALAVVLAMLGTAAFGATVERVALRPLVGRPVYAAIMVTVGLLFIMEQLATTIWGHNALTLGDPWGLDTVTAGDVVMPVKDLWTIGLAALALAAFFVLLRYTRIGVAMRATAADPEAALAQGISAGRITAVSWAIAAALATVAGVTFAAGPNALSPGLSTVALIAFPAMILGGMDSPGGAVVGGLIIGLVQSLTAGYQEDVLPWAGENVHHVMPFVVMILILLVRPYGLFGTREVRRI
ncbi:MAG: branched-chain amino acid ABC transporter permease [Solirubrobacteraceae bacterium]|nr:branched-chain amino acid ABC transporter permease [Solirubrobacteraceae bacterium]